MMRYADNCCQCEESFTPRHTYTFTGPVMFGEGTHSVTVYAEDLFAYRQGSLIQNAFPYLSVDDREFLMTGMRDF